MKGTGQPSGKQKFDGWCYVCGRYGHSSNYCWNVMEVGEEEEVQREVDFGGQEMKRALQQSRELNMIAASSTWKWRKPLHSMTPEQQEERIQRSMANASTAMSD